MLIRRKRRGEKGQALVELAIALPLLIMLLFMFIDFSQVMVAKIAATHLARDAARYGATEGVSESSIRSRIITSGDYILDDPRTEHKMISVNKDTFNGVGEIKVNIELGLRLYAPFVSGILPDPFVVKGKAVMRVVQ